jgi:hypothetical protein
MQPHEQETVHSYSEKEQPTSTEAPLLRLVAYVKPESFAFFREHGCVIQEQERNERGGHLITFPVGSRQEPISAKSKRCSHILLPDDTCITAMDCSTRSILLFMNPMHGYCIHLST